MSPGCLQLMGEKAAKVENFGAYLSHVLSTAQDRKLLQLAAEVLGHLVRSNSQLTAALVDNEVEPPTLNTLKAETQPPSRIATLCSKHLMWSAGASVGQDFRIPVSPLLGGASQEKERQTR